MRGLSGTRTRGIGLEAARRFRPQLPQPGMLAETFLRETGKFDCARFPLPAPLARAADTVEVNSRLRQLSTLLMTLAGSSNELRLELSERRCRVHCSPKALELAVIEAVSQLRHQLAGPGVIVIRTRPLRHALRLTVAAREYGDAVFRFGGWRTPRQIPADQMFGAARRLALASHGRFRQRGSATLVLRLPTILRLVVRKRPADAAPSPQRKRKEMQHEDRQPIAA